MQRRRLLAGLGAGLATGLAGCSDDTGDDPGTGDGSDDASPIAAADAPWREGDGLAVETLAESHVEALVDAGGFTLFSTAETSHDGDEEPGSWLPSQEYEARFEADGQRRYLRQHVPADDYELVWYTADGTTYARQREGDQVAYDASSADADFEGAMRAEAGTGVQGLARWNMAVDGAEQRDGERVTRFAADAFEGEQGVPETVETAAAETLIGDPGLVHRIDQHWAGPHQGVHAEVDVDIAFRDVGTVDLDEPDWLDEARADTDAE